jgi:hypothetical protein
VATPEGQGIGFAVTAAQIAPTTDPAWGLAGPAGRRKFWLRAAELVPRAYAADRRRRVDRFGQPLANLSPVTIAHRKSAMGPAVKNAPQFTPAGLLSRTISYLRVKVLEDSLWVSWKFDPFTRQWWGQVLQWHAEGLVKGAPPRDVIGLSPAALRWLAKEMTTWWAKHRAELAERGARRALRSAPLSIDLPGLTPTPTATTPAPRSTRAAEVLRRVRGQAADGGPLPARGGRPLERLNLEHATFHTADRQTAGRLLGAGSIRGWRSGTDRPTGGWFQAPPPIRFGPSQARVRAVHGTGETELAAARQLFGERFELQDFASVVGAPHQAVVRVEAFRDEHGPAIQANVHADEIDQMVRIIHRAADGTPVIHNVAFRLGEEHRSAGLALDLFGRQVEQAARWGVTRLDTLAYRDDAADWFGHYVWARYGYDGPIPPDVQERLRGSDLPAALRRATRVAEVMGDERGRAWWREHGDTFPGTFDLRPGSRSRRAFFRYFRSRRPG